MRRFFVLYLPDRSWQAYLDLMRLVCDPSAQSPAHITVRGPYASKPALLSDWRKIKHIDVAVVGLGTFFGDRQNTVFLECNSPQLPEIWWKKHYKNGTPHLTIYDGRSRELATRVFEVLGEYSWNFAFVADRLHEFVSTGPQMRLDLRWSDYGLLMRKVFGQRFSREQLRELSEPDRLQLLDQVAAAFMARKVESNGASVRRRQLEAKARQPKLQFTFRKTAL